MTQKTILLIRQNGLLVKRFKVGTQFPFVVFNDLVT